MNVVTYSRESTNKSEQKPEVQVGELRRYCKARGFKINHEVVDRTSGGTDQRPGFKRLLQLVRTREVDAVVDDLPSLLPEYARKPGPIQDSALKSHFEMTVWPEIEASRAGVLEAERTQLQAPIGQSPGEVTR